MLVPSTTARVLTILADRHYDSLTALADDVPAAMTTVVRQVQRLEAHGLVETRLVVRRGGGVCRRVILTELGRQLAPVLSRGN